MHNEHEYQFKIKKGDLEFEFSTTDKFTFEEKLSDWVNGIVKGEYVCPPAVEPEPILYADETDKPQRSGFIEVKNLSTIKEIQAPAFETVLPLEPVGIDFEKALEESVSNPMTEVVEKLDPIADFKTFADSFNPVEQTDFLVITALYILNMENLERFSIKQLNAKLVPLNGKPIDHSIVSEAIERNLLRIIPDLTGTSEVTEYTLTDEGEGYFVQ